MGRKYTLPYALYRTTMFINPLLADPERNGTGFSEDDLALLKEALANMFEHDRSAARGVMTPVAIVAFRHDNPMGNARADQLLSRVRCTPAEGVAATTEAATAGNRPPRSKADFAITVDESDLPKGVTIEHWL